MSNNNKAFAEILRPFILLSDIWKLDGNVTSILRDTVARLDGDESKECLPEDTLICFFEGCPNNKRLTYNQREASQKFFNALAHAQHKETSFEHMRMAVRIIRKAIVFMAKEAQWEKRAHESLDTGLMNAMEFINDGVFDE